MKGKTILHIYKALLNDILMNRLTISVKYMFPFEAQNIFFHSSENV